MPMVGFRKWNTKSHIDEKHEKNKTGLDKMDLCETKMRTEDMCQ